MELPHAQDGRDHESRAVHDEGHEAGRRVLVVVIRILTINITMILIMINVC